jgi:hypothetical protein
VGEIADHILAEVQGFHPRHRIFGELTVGRLTRAATLLQQQAAPAPVVVPVAVSERPWERRLGWCDKQNKCWAWSLEMKCWQLLDPRILADWVPLLPFHAILLPQTGEGEA